MFLTESAKGGLTKESIWRTLFYSSDMSPFLVSAEKGLIFAPIIALGHVWLIWISFRNVP